MRFYPPAVFTLLRKGLLNAWVFFPSRQTAPIPSMQRSLKRIITLLLWLADWDLKQGRLLSLVCNHPWDMGAQGTTVIHSQEISSMIKQSPKHNCTFLWLRHSRGACPEQQVTFAHNILFYSHYLQAPVASRLGGPPVCAGFTQTSSQGWQQTKPEARIESRAFSTQSLFHFDSCETMATKGNAIQGHTAHHIHIDAGAKITVFIDNSQSQR